MQISPPRAPQLALGPQLPSLRTDLAQTSAAIGRRRELFKRVLAQCPGWELGSIGGYFAFVAFPAVYLDVKIPSRTPDEPPQKVDGLLVAKVLGERFGVVTLPAKFFVPDDYNDPNPATAGLTGWLRFAVANVDDAAIEQVGPRLGEMNRFVASLLSS